MARAGVFGPGERVELINGEVIRMTPIGPEHAGITDKLAYLFRKHFQDQYICRVQAPQAAREDSEPEPDIQLLAWRDDFYRSAHPTPNEIALVVEVADTSLGKDEGIKLGLYAAVGIPEYWVVDVNRKRITVYRTPRPDDESYAHSATYTPGQRFNPLGSAGFELDVDWLFGS